MHKRPRVVTAAAISQSVVAADVLFAWLMLWGHGLGAVLLATVFLGVPLFLSVSAATGLWRGTTSGWWTATVSNLAGIVVLVAAWSWWGSGRQYFRQSLDVVLLGLTLVLLLLPPVRRFYDIRHKPTELFSDVSDWAMSSKAWQYPVAFVTGAAFDAVFFWQFSSYSARGGLYPSVYLPWWSLPVLAFTAGFVLTLGRTHHRLLMPVALLGGFCIANACFIVADCWKNPTNHNLWPFEFVEIAVLTAPAFLGTALNALLQRRRKQ